MKLRKKQRRLWQYYIWQLKKHFPVGVPVIVKSRPVKGWSGSCDGAAKLGRLVDIRIIINSNMPWVIKTESLIHEWAHAMEWSSSWKDYTLKRIHNETWGVWYSKIYQHLNDRCWEDMGNRGLLTKRQMKLFPLDIYKWDG